MELPQLERVGAEVHKEARLAGDWLNGFVHVGREHGVLSGSLLEADDGGCLAGKHLGAIHGAGIRTDEYVAIKVIERNVVSIGPNTELRIVVEQTSEGKSIA